MEAIPTLAAPHAHHVTTTRDKSDFYHGLLVALVAPYYPKAGNGTQPYPLDQVLRVYCLQQWFNLSDPAAEEALRHRVDAALRPY